ncbi:MAG TPA: hypothetical protein VKZ49_02025 [Polyangiaceae bacterium]|nr:hypothetical protein [Polyangiaceae bacterium]
MTSPGYRAGVALFCLAVLLACRIGPGLDAEVPLGPKGAPQAKLPRLLPKGSPLPPDAREIAIIEVSAPPEVQTFGAYEVADECRSANEAMFEDIRTRAMGLGCNAVVEIGRICSPRIARLRGICLQSAAFAPAQGAAALAKQP